LSRNVVRARLLAHGLLEPASRERSDAPRVSTPLPSRSAARVRIAHQSFGVLSLLKATAALEDALAARGVRIEWTDCDTGMQVVDALAGGDVDLGVVGEAPPVFAQAAHAPVVYLAAEPPAPEGEAIVVPAGSAARSLRDLRGKVLAVSRGANVVYFVLRALEEAGLAIDDVEVRTLSPVDARAAFERQQVAGWAIWNPLLASLQQTFPTRVLRDARGLASNRAFYVGRRAFADEHPDLVDAFLAQVGAVGRWANESPASAARILAPQLNLATSAVAAALSLTPFDTQPIDAEVVASQQDVADTLHRGRFIARPVNVEEAVWTRPWTVRRSA
jgi:sulfonate transport system substrate-binding protein